MKTIIKDGWCSRWICTHHSNITGSDNKKDIRREIYSRLVPTNRK